MSLWIHKHSLRQHSAGGLHTPSTVHFGDGSSHSAQRIETVSIHSLAYFTRPITGSSSSHGTVLGRVDSLDTKIYISNYIFDF